MPPPRPLDLDSLTRTDRPAPRAFAKTLAKLKATAKPAAQGSVTVARLGAGLAAAPAAEARRRWFSPRAKGSAASPRAREPQKPRRLGASSREWLAFGSSFLSFLLLVQVAAFALHHTVLRVVDRPGPAPAEHVVMIPRGQSIDQLGESLRTAGVIEDADAFVWGSRLLRMERQSGEYRFPARASMRQVMQIIGSGRVVQHAVTIPEGLTSWQIVQRLNEFDVLAGDVRQVPAEGSLLPNTYRVPRGYSRERLLRLMAEERNRVLAEVWQRRRSNLPLRTPDELVTLASIVEKETGRAEERARVAGVFVNRLNRRMRLQSDPTTIYGVTEGRGVLGRGLTRAELDRATPYNTYVIPALPPTPIANVGREALEAVANPMQHGEYFFVADGTGGHTFSATLEQHNRAVQRWREIERARGGQAPASLDTPAPAAPSPQPARPQRGAAATLAR